MNALRFTWKALALVLALFLVGCQQSPQQQSSTPSPKIELQKNWKLLNFGAPW